jgi:hypothetical protein
LNRIAVEAESGPDPDYEKEVADRDCSCDPARSIMQPEFRTKSLAQKQLRSPQKRSSVLLDSVISKAFGAIFIEGKYFSTPKMRSEWILKLLIERIVEKSFKIFTRNALKGTIGYCFFQETVVSSSY